jgi:uncharacterized RDD family membrane protein YckC
LARCIDSVVIVILLALAQLVTVVVFQRPRGLSSILFFAALSFTVWIGYGTVMESSRWQATAGKLWMGLKVYNPSGGRLSALQAAGRNVIKDGPFIAVAFLPGGRALSLLWIGAHLVVLHQSPVYQAIHDRAAKTWVAAPESTIQLHLS